MSEHRIAVGVRPTSHSDFDAIIALTRAVYPGTPAWTTAQLEEHLRVFPEGQFVAERIDDGSVVGMAASLVVNWDDYHIDGSWRDFTAGGFFTNHDIVHGRTLYGAEVMVDPGYQGSGIGSLLYVARKELAQRLGLLRIRAGARLRSYHTVAEQMTPKDYAAAVERGGLSDPTLSFQLGRGFRIIGVVSGYLRSDAESLGYAAIIEWLNPDVASSLAGRSQATP